MKWRLGTCGWSYEDWKGSFYPPGCRDPLAYYAEHFDSLEIDSTWYHSPSRRVVAGWRDRTPEGFRFAAKMPREITHERHFQDCETTAAAFLHSIEALGEKLAVVLVQFSPRIRANELGRIEGFLRGLPGEFRFAVEPRHRSWLTEPRLPGLLSELNMALVMADHDYYPRFDAVTADIAYVRLLGRHGALPDATRAHAPRDEDLFAWAERLKQLPPKVQCVYLYANNQFEGHSPCTIRKVRELLPGAAAPSAAQGRLDL